MITLCRQQILTKQHMRAYSDVWHIGAADQVYKTVHFLELLCQHQNRFLTAHELPDDSKSKLKNLNTVLSYFLENIQNGL